MSIQTIIKIFVVASLLSFSLTGAGWSGEHEQKPADEEASVDAAPPADAADTDDNAKADDAADAEMEEAATD